MVADATRGFAPPESEGSLYMRLGRMCASVGVQRAEDFDERAHLLEPLGACTTELPAAAAASLDSAHGCGAAPAKLGLPAVTAGPPTPPGVPRCEGATCVQRRAESVVLRFVQADMMRRTQHA